MPKVKITGLPQMKKGGTYKKSKSKNKFTNMYEGGGNVPTPMYNPSVPEVSVFDLTKQAMGGLMYEEGGPTEPPADSTAYYNAEAKFQTDLAKTHAKYGNRKAAEEAMTKARKAYSDASRQQFKGKPGFDKMGNPIKALGGPIKAGEGYVQNEPSEGFAEGGAYATSDSPRPQKTSGLMNYLGYDDGGYINLDGDPPIKTATTNTVVPNNAIVNPTNVISWPAADQMMQANQPKYAFQTRKFTPEELAEMHKGKHYGKKSGLINRMLRGMGVDSKPIPNITGMFGPCAGGNCTKAYGGVIDDMLQPFKYASGGKLPEPVLRARLNAHMSPEEVDSYIANYANGGQTGTGILGNMTYDLKPWKYVAGGQLGPYPYSSYKSDLSEFKEGGIHIKPENRGKFTAAAKKAGMGVQEYAKHVMANKENYSPTLVKRANFARNAAKWHHAYGGMQPLPEFARGGDGPRPRVRYTKDGNYMYYGTPANDWEKVGPYTVDKMNWFKRNFTPEGRELMRDMEAGETSRQLINRGFSPENPYSVTDPNIPADVDPAYRRNANELIRSLAKAGIAPDVLSNFDSKPKPVGTKTNNPQYTDNTIGTTGAKDSGYQDPKLSNSNWYYASQYLQQAAPELSYLLNEGKNYDIAPEYTYTPEQMSARMPLIEYTSGMAQMRNKMREAYGNNPALYLASLQNLAAQSAKGRAGIVEGIDLQNIAARNAAQQANIGYKQMSDEATARNKQAALNQYYQTLESLGTTGATVGKDVRADEMDKYKWQYLPEMYRAMKLDPEQMALYNEILGKKKKKTKTTKEETKKV